MRIPKLALILGGIAAFAGAPITIAQQQRSAVVGSSHGDENVKREVRHELVMLPWYSVFDNLAYSVNGSR